MKLLGLDPGQTTGMCIYQDSSGYLGFVAKTPGQVLEHIYQYGTTYDAVIVEDYNGQLISADGLMTVRLIGGIEALCQVLNIYRVLQFPQERYPHMAEAKTLVASFGPDTRHARDATAHVLLYQKRFLDNTVTLITKNRRKLGEGK